MGDDLTVVNSARVSFDKWKDQMEARDIGLIEYLARNGHWTPFSQVQFQFRITMPIFVARQWFKHQIGFTRNEVSRRYVDSRPEFYVPEKWRLRHESAKQGSSDETITHSDTGDCIKDSVDFYVQQAISIYKALLADGIAPEMARMVLPQNMMTSFVETGSLAAYARLCKLRLDPHSQWETQLYACAISEIIEGHCPSSWMNLMGYELDHEE
jgi:thymidylate synthase (FAD)